MLMQSQEPTPRQAGRVLVIDPAGRVLLLQGFDPARPGSLHWVTIGGGTDHGEGTAQAALRELWEESGIKASAGELIGPVWHRTTEFSFAGMRFWQEEDYYVLRVGEVQVTLANLDPFERDTITGYRWWSREELAATTESFFPAELPELMRLADDAS
jgi:8-oxo-dGTP pyrophosphatase MutT (NUDIX family)